MFRSVAFSLQPVTLRTPNQIRIQWHRIVPNYKSPPKEIPTAVLCGTILPTHNYPPNKWPRLHFWYADFRPQRGVIYLPCKIRKNGLKGGYLLGRLLGPFQKGASYIDRVALQSLAMGYLFSVPRRPCFFCLLLSFVPAANVWHWVSRPMRCFLCVSSSARGTSWSWGRWTAPCGSRCSRQWLPPASHKHKSRASSGLPPVPKPHTPTEEGKMYL